MKAPIRQIAPLLTAVLLGLSLSAHAAPDWSKAAKRKIYVFHPGVSPIEWIVQKGGHGGANGFRNKGETCAGCHEDAGELNFDMEKLSTSPLEPVGAPATKIYPVEVQAAYDDKQLYLRLSFKAPTGGVNKADADNAVKVTVLMPDDKVKYGTQAGCWATCHDNLRTMPGADEKKTKYVPEGSYSLMQWASKDNKVSDGSVSTERVMSGGNAGVTADAKVTDGNYVVTFARSNPGEGKTVTFGFAIHSDHASGRFHHVSLGYTLGIGADGDIKATKL